MNKVTKKKRKKRNTMIISSLCLILGVLIGIIVGMSFFKTEENTTNNDKTLYEIETPYCTLYYPNQWDNEIKIEQIEDEAYIVKFSALLDNKGKQHLFDVIFNSESQELGYFDTKDGKVSVDVIPADIIFDDTWTDAEKNMIYSMQEEINYMIEKLTEQDGFVEY